MSRSLYAVASLLTVIAACGGKVVFDGAPGTGQGGASSSTSTPASSPVTSTGDVNPVGGGGDGPFGCMNPPDPATLSFCNGSAVGAGTGSGSSCSTTLCASNGDIYDETCQGNGCVCKRNGNVICTCALNGPGEFCTGLNPPCCPFGK